MSEPEDAVVPILRNIQNGIARIEAKVVAIEEKVLDHDDRFDALERLLTFHLGLTTKNEHRLDEPEPHLGALNRRVKAMEERS